jgi:hypothetical protein
MKEMAVREGDEDCEDNHHPLQHELHDRPNQAAVVHRGDTKINIIVHEV